MPLMDASHWFTWVLATVLYDLCYYWLHRMGHERTILWAAHVAHHQSEDYNLTTALRQTSTGFLLGWIFYLPLFLIGFPLSIIGALSARTAVQLRAAPLSGEDLRRRLMRHRLWTQIIGVVSLTITEGGYYLDEGSGEFDAGHPDIVHDLALLHVLGVRLVLIQAHVVDPKDLEGLVAPEVDVTPR